MKRRKINNFRLFEGKKVNDRHVRITEDMICSEAWVDLKAISIKLYISLKLRFTGNNQDSIEFPHSQIAKIGISKDSIKGCFDDLVNHGFIEYVNQGQFTRTPNVYKLSSNWRVWKRPEGELRKHVNKKEPSMVNI